MKDVISRVSIPARVLDLLWIDDEFFREVSSNKKVSSSGKFPRCDQWCDVEGFHMAFALAGYSPDDIVLKAKGNEVFITGSGNKIDAEEMHEALSDQEEYPAKAPNIVVQRGMIVRGIARRNFKAKFYINPTFNVGRMSASMKNGLLELVIPRKAEEEPKTITIKEI
jgi:HSP20 family molecular chaperone IbpA